MSKGIMEMERALLPCGMMAWPAYQLPSETRVFKSYFGACATGKCPKKHLTRNNPFDLRRERRGIRTPSLPIWSQAPAAASDLVSEGWAFESLW